MARGVTQVVVVVVGLFLGTATAFQKYHYYGYQSPPTAFFPPTVFNTQPVLPAFLYSAGPVRAVGKVVNPLLPCPAAGFYSHPTNCSRFYRCVDHSGSGRFFVRHVFECPAGNVFDVDVLTCLQAPCDPTKLPMQPSPTQPPVQPTDSPVYPPPTQPPPIQPTQPPPTQPTQPPVQPTDPPPTESPIQSTDPPVYPTPTQPPVQSTDPPTYPPTTQPPIQPTDPPVYPTPTQPPAQPIDPPVQPPPTPSEDCEGPYLQHEKYCNVYRRCNDTVQRYICPLGTVFDQSRQMCRISAADEVLCAGKTIAQLPLFLRAEVVEGHILLPHDFILRPLRHFLTQPLQHTLRNQGPQGLPGGHPSVYHNPQGSSFFGVPPSGLPAPYHSLPADTIPVFSQPLAASYPYSGYYSGFDPTVESSVNNVRRPEGHLHGGYYSSYDPTVESSVNNVRRPQGHLHSGYYSRFDAPVESSVSNVRRPDGPLHFPGYSHYNPGMYYR